MPRPEIDSLVNFSERSARQSLLMQLAPLKGEYDVTCKPVKPTRSGRQNRYLFGVVYRAFIDFMREQGESVTTDEAHEFFKLRFGLRRQIHNPATGEVVEVNRSTTTYSVGEMMVYLDLIISFMQELGVVVPDPSEYGFALSRPSPLEVP